jgi:class 3 adenylate cyclase/tetratricopeptide (TPR) repeat protein
LEIGGADLQSQLATTQEEIRRLRRYIPSVVAEGILHDQDRLRGERREIAVLFADAVDFTRLSASLDAESVFNLINDLLSRLVECVHRYDGMVDKFTGDGLMAVFGAPIAHESDPELAVRAALDMQKVAAEFEPVARAQLGAPLKIRIGIHSGPVIAGILGTREQAAYTVIGETVNLAARLEGSASPGSILVSSRVYGQTRALFNFRSLGTTRLKGVDRPVHVYEASGDRAVPLPTRGVTGVESIFLGRDGEFSQLTAVLEGFLDDRQGRLVVVQGEAGMGKSRLVSEGLSTLDSDQVVTWWGHGLPYAQGVGYGVFRSLMQNAIHSHWAEGAWDELISPAMRPFLRQMLELPLTAEDRATLRNLEPERIKQLTTLAMREWLLVNARQQPILLVMEDFHWADDLSRDMLESLVNLAQDAPVFFCVITRPTPEAPLDLFTSPAKEASSGPSSLFLELEPLSPEHSRLLLAHLIDLSDLSDRLVDTILDRAQGIPFYIEEFVRMLVEKDILRLGEERWRVASTVALEALEIPTTLRGLMMARVDRLPQDLQHVLRNAAVIGLQFSAQLLEEVEHRIRGTTSVQPSLERLCDLGLLLERPEAGEQVYAFRHILTQETIYSSLLRSRRPDTHRTVAECIEQIYAEDLTSQVEVLAFHYDQARVRDKALRYALLAGDRARARFANREAIEYYSRALQLSQHLSGHERERWEAAVGLGEVEQHIGEYEEAVAIYKAALEDWGGATAEARARVMLNMGQVWDKRGELDEAGEWLRQGLMELDRTGMASPDLRAEIYSELGWLSLRRGGLSAAQDWLGRGLELVQGTEHYDVLSSILNRLGGVHYHRGKWQAATECVERALELRKQLGDIVGMARSFNNLGILKKISGDWEGALADYQRSVELHDQIGDVEGLTLAHTNLGILHTERGEWDRAEENLRQSLEIAQQIDHPYELAQAYKNLGRLYLLQERWEEAEQNLDIAVPMYNEAGAQAHLNLNDAYYLQGRLCLDRGDVDRAEGWAQRSYDLLQRITRSTDGESVEWGRYEQLVGRIARARGDLEMARRHLERGAAIFRASGAPIDVGRAVYRSALLSFELGQMERAREELREAEQIFERLGAKADLKRVEERRLQFGGV